MSEYPGTVQRRTSCPTRPGRGLRVTTGCGPAPMSARGETRSSAPRIVAMRARSPRMSAMFALTLCNGRIRLSGPIVAFSRGRAGAGCALHRP